MLEVARYTPSQARELGLAGTSLRDLVYRGYEWQAGVPMDPDKVIKDEFPYEDDRAKVYLAKKDGVFVGELTMILWKDNPWDKRGSLFWPELDRIDHDLTDRAASNAHLAVEVGGVVTHPDMRGQGLGMEMYRHAIADLNPDFILGQSKTVGAVQLRSHLPGYRTFYGNTEVTVNHTQSHTTIHRTVLEAYHHAREVTPLAPSGVVFEYTGAIGAHIPDASAHPPAIQEAFAPLVAAYKTHSRKNVTLMSALVSVRKGLLERPSAQ